MSGIFLEICARSVPPEAGVLGGPEVKNKDLSGLSVKMG
jgi:hypothetical protein